MSLWAAGAAGGKFLAVDLQDAGCAGLCAPPCANDPCNTRCEASFGETLVRIWQSEVSEDLD